MLLLSIFYRNGHTLHVLKDFSTKPQNYTFNGHDVSKYLTSSQDLHVRFVEDGYLKTVLQPHVGKLRVNFNEPILEFGVRCFEIHVELLKLHFKRNGTITVCILITRISYNNNITWYMYRNTSRFAYVFILRSMCYKAKCPNDIEIPPECAVALLHRLGQSHLRFALVSLPRTVALVECRLNV